MSELPLNFSVEKNSGVVLTGNDQERAQVVTGLSGRLIIERDFSGSGVGRKTRSRRRWLGSCWCGSGHGGDGDGWSRNVGSGCGGLRYWRSLMSSREKD